MTKKDTIYIDNQDDITAIIEKVKESEAKVVALVPPKRSSVLESIVNVKLLKKMSGDSHKQLVLVTKDKKIVALAGAVKLHVADNLKSTPHIPKISGPKSHDEIEIEDEDGEELNVQTSVGELDESGTKESEDTPKKEEATTEGTKSEDSDSSESKKAKVAKTASKSKKSKKISVPNFEAFRTRLLLILGVLVLAGVGVWWALTILPSAKIDLYAQTTPVDTTLEFTADATRGVDDLGTGQISARQSEVKKSVTGQFTPTGEKEVGERASGVVTVTNCEDSTGFTLTAGSTLTHGASGLDFTSQADVFIPGSNFSGGGTVCDESGFADVAVTAAESGTDYNVEAGSYSVSGLGQVLANGSSMSGGTSEILTIVSQEDIDAALSKLLDENDASVQDELTLGLGEDIYVLEESLTKSTSGISSVPKLGEEASSAQVTVTLTYSLLGVPTSSLSVLLDQTQADTIDETKQIIENGFEEAKLSLVSDSDEPKVMSFELSTRAFVGPRLDFDAIKQQVEGKRFSETRQIIENIEGINRVEIDYSPFWVSNTPRPDKTEINLVINERQ